MSDRPILWDWVRAAYAAPEVEALCLELQDRHGQSVCLLLWAGWAAIGGRTPTDLDLVEAASVARTWETQLVGPLRTARRALKTEPGLATQTRARLRAQVQASELAAEQALLLALEPLGGPVATDAWEPAAAMAAASRAWGEPAPARLIEALAAVLPGR